VEVGRCTREVTKLGNSVVVHPQLSHNNGFPMDVAPVGAGSVMVLLTRLQTLTSGESYSMASMLSMLFTCSTLCSNSSVPAITAGSGQGLAVWAQPLASYGPESAKPCQLPGMKWEA
jgi:hypothetical protein